MNFRLIVLIICSLSLSCKKNIIKSTPDSNLPLDIVKTAFPSEKYDIILNEKEDHAIVCTHFPKNDKSGFATLILKIYDIKNKEVIYEDRIPKGKSFWLSNDLVGIQSKLGIIKSEEEGIDMKKYNVYTRSFQKD